MHSLRLLLVEDDPTQQALVKGNLRRDTEAIDVWIADTGKDALNLLDVEPGGQFRCVIVDYNLPDRNAPELIPQLSSAGIRCPILVISSSGEQRVAIESIRAGASDFIPKHEAYQNGCLWKRVSHAVRIHRKEEKNRRRIERRAQRLAQLAEQDPMTRLANRRCLDRMFRNHRQTFDRRGSTSVVMFDIDHFKNINDTLGHPAGDQVLCAVADTLRQAVRRNDILFRYGGEEFVAIRPWSSLASTVQWAEFVRDRLRRRVIRIDGTPVRVTASIGVANAPSRNISTETVDQADKAMYLAKTRGRDRCCTWELARFFELVRLDSVRRGKTVEDRLQRLLANVAKDLGRTQHTHLTAHGKRVGFVAAALGRALKLQREQIADLRIAGLLHDLGKFAIPETVLAKPGPLTASEWNLIQRHADDGAAMAEALGASTLVANLVRLHHCRFDANNEAHGLSADAIPVGARILAVADAFETMTSYRAYQPTRSLLGAVRELQQDDGIQWDPRVTEALPRAVLGQSRRITLNPTLAGLNT